MAYKADKVIAIKIDVQGTSEQNKKLAQLEKSVKELTDERRRLNKAVKDGTITLDQYSREIARVNTQLRGTRRELGQVRNGMLGINSFTERLSGGFNRLGKSLSGAFVGLFAIQQLGRIMSNAVNIVKEFEQQMANVRAITGATEQEFQALTKSAKELGATTQFTAKEVGQLQEEYAKLGFTTQQILDASEATLELATATGSDLAQSAKVAAATINGFGLEAKDTQRIVDVMAKSFTSSALDLSKFETAMAAVAPAAAAVGLSVEETTASLGVLVDSGIDASTAGTGLRNILLDTQKAGISVSEAMTMIKESTDPTTTAFDLFGKRGAVVALTLANSTDKTAKFTKELKNAQGAASAMAKVVGDTLEGDVKRLNSAWEGLVLNIGENGQSAFRGMTQSVTDLLNTLGDLTKNTHAESEALEQQRIKVNVLVGRIANLNKGTDERKKLIEELNIISPKFLEGLDKENLSNETLAKRLKEVNKELVNQILIKREDEKLAEQAEEQANAQNDLINAQITLEEQLLKTRESGFKGISKENDLKKTSIEQAKELLSVLEDQSVRSQTTTSFGGIVESTNAQADAYDNLSSALRQVTLSAVELNNEDKKAVDLAEKREIILKKLGITTEENTKAVNANNVAATKSAENLKTINEEIEEIDIDIFDDDELEKQELYFENLEGSFEGLNDLITKDDIDLTKTQQEQADKRVESFGNEAQRKLELERKFAEDVKNEQLNIAQQAAEGLLEVSGRRFEREKTLELANLDARLEQGLISQADFEKEREAIERKAFQRQKKLELAQIAISLAREIASINANAAANPANALTFGAAGISQASVLTGLAVARSAVQAGVIASQSFAEGGYTGDGVGSADATGFKQAGVVHEGEYVVPKNVLESQRGGQLVGALEAMRNSRPMPYINSGFANGGGALPQASMDMVELENRIANAVASSVGSIRVTNVATETVTEAVRVNNIIAESTFG